MTVLQACRWAEAELGELESPGLEAELILCDLMNWKRHELYLNHESDLRESCLTMYRKRVRRRKNREPLQHITGKVDFLGRSFIAGPGALIARPETELLTELFMNGLSEPRYILDAGIGSGIIGVSLALAYPTALVIGTDISREALMLSCRNKELFNVRNLVLVRTDLIEALRQDIGIFDGIVANLPYIPSGLIHDLEPEVRDGDPLIALDGGHDGLELVRSLLVSAPGILRGGGVLALELDREQVETVSKLLEKNPLWEDVRAFNDLAGHPRVVTARVGHNIVHLQNL
ncbi:peptide chain release factor N(5)-glutamine methyltransferase [Candidatus Fermentibacteria bacterium]|nr:MAG: peptide chain release factor N(5)-glutamine methyltransferase [Candidatus Fermentibacteria bacterium]